MNEIILAQDAATTSFDGLQSLGYGLATIGPGLGIGILAVSYTHLTLPTIYSV